MVQGHFSNSIFGLGLFCISSLSGGCQTILLHKKRLLWVSIFLTPPFFFCISLTLHLISCHCFHFSLHSSTLQLLSCKSLRCSATLTIDPFWRSFILPVSRLAGSLLISVYGNCFDFFTCPIIVDIVGSLGITVQDEMVKWHNVVIHSQLLTGVSDS